jgi:hypothetical protein
MRHAIPTDIWYIGRVFFAKLSDVFPLPEKEPRMCFLRLKKMHKLQGNYLVVWKVLSVIHFELVCIFLIYYF